MKQAVSLALLAASTQASSGIFKASAPAKVPNNASWVVPHDFASYSWPGHWFADFAGNASHPNLFSRDILDLLAKKSGQQPFIRVGGTSTDRIRYNASQEIGLRNVFEQAGSLTANIGIPDWVDIGPVFFEGFKNFPDTRWSWQLNMGKSFNLSWGLDNALEVAGLVMHAVGDRLESFEIGNEPDIFDRVGHRPEGYTADDYIREWNEYADACSERVLKGNPYGLEETRFFQGLTAAIHLNAHNDISEYSVQSILHGGLDKHGHVKAISMHHYDSAGQEWVRLQGSFMNHTNVAGNVSEFDADVAASHSWEPYLPFVLGETNSDASNLNASQYIGVFGSALWTIDRTLMSMAANMQRQNLIQGTTFGYTQWVPVPLDGRQPYVRPPFYGQLFVADVIGRHPEVQVYPLPASEWNMPVHAIYEAGRLAKYVVINFDEYNSTATYERPSREVRLGVPRSAKSVSVERLTAAGADSDEGIEWAGLSWNYTNGRLAEMGEYESETVRARKGVVSLNVPATQAVLVTLEKEGKSYPGPN